MASTTKIMTLIVTLENANLDEIVTVSEYAAGMPDVQLGVRVGEQYLSLIHISQLLFLYRMRDGGSLRSDLRTGFF